MSVWHRWRKRQKAHYVRDYEKHVRRLVSAHPLEEAMSLAVGGNYNLIGELQAKILKEAGLNGKAVLVDIGCGSGRLSKALGVELPNLKYLGTDVVPALLEYAKTQAPSNYRFTLHQELSIPAGDASVDFVCAFSVFTHLFHEETYLYLQDVERVLRPEGCLIFSFLEYSRHWSIFAEMLRPDWQTARPHLNMFIERSSIAEWALHVGLSVERYDVGPSIGQSVVLLRKPMRP